MVQWVRSMCMEIDYIGIYIYILFVIIAGVMEMFCENLLCHSINRKIFFLQVTFYGQLEKFFLFLFSVFSFSLVAIDMKVSLSGIRKLN